MQYDDIKLYFSKKVKGYKANPRIATPQALVYTKSPDKAASAFAIMISQEVDNMASSISFNDNNLYKEIYFGILMPLSHNQINWNFIAEISQSQEALDITFVGQSATDVQLKEKKIDAKGFVTYAIKKIADVEIININNQFCIVCGTSLDNIEIKRDTQSYKLHTTAIADAKK